MNNYFSILFFIRESRLKKNGEAPLFLRVTISGKRAEVRLKRSIPVNKWNSKKEWATGKDRLSLEVNQYLDVVQASILSIFTELKQKNHLITPEILIRKFEG